MNGFQNGKNSHLDESFPGCLGRMVNLFDLNSGVAGNRLLTDKPHGSLSRSQSDVVRVCPSEDQIEEKMIVSDLKRINSNGKSNGTPMKMLIAQEMSKETESRQNPPGVVAKLMGLDAFPTQRSVSAPRSHFRGHSRCHTDPSISYCQHENGSLMEEMHYDFHQYPEQNEYKDVYEVWQLPTKANSVRNKSPQKARRDETNMEQKVAFVRQKFIEAKGLSIDGKLRQSKEFQDALDVLSSNTDLFLKFLQEPNQMFSQHLRNLKSASPPETKRITVLRPSKMVDNSRFGELEEKSKKEISPPSAGWKIDEHLAQPTRIVVLKPSRGKTHNCRAANSPPSASPRASKGETNFVNIEDNEAQDSVEVSSGTTQKMRDNPRGHRRDETLLSSVSSNGYIGDESSFNKSENEYVAGNLSDSEVVSPVSRHSWDYINRFGGPYSCSSVSRVSYSPESLVSKEAKKRLSERWAMVASNGRCQEHRPPRRSSSTLGEMLALSDSKKTEGKELESSKEEPGTSSSNSMYNFSSDKGMDASPRSLSRSKSVPVSSTAFGAQLNVDIQGPETGKTNPPKETTKPKSTKLSLKNLFFSRNKKKSKDSMKHLQSNDEMRSGAKFSHHPAKIDNDISKFLNDPGLECSSAFLHKSPVSSNLFGEQGAISPEDGLFVSEILPSRNICENMDQPSPVSVLETTFEEDEHLGPISSGRIRPDYYGGELSVDPVRCNLIDKSPPIGSIARTLSWNDSSVDTACSVSLRPSSFTCRTKEEEKEWFSFVQTLLTVAGLTEVQCDTFLLMWHSPESPLDPLLREKYVDLNEKDTTTLHEPRQRQRRSTRKLVFDCVNATLMEITGYGQDTCQRAIPYSGVGNKLAEQVWGRMKEWFCSEVECLSGDDGDVNSLVVDGMVRKEVVGEGWFQYLRLERDNIGREIERKLLEELVHESVTELTGRV